MTQLTIVAVLSTVRAASSKVSLPRGPYPVMSYTGVWVDRGQAKERSSRRCPRRRRCRRHMTEERDW